LQNAVARDLISHAYLLTGPRGTGKTSTARILAKVLNCKNIKDNNPCNECDTCTQITEGNLIDIVEIDAASNRGIDEIRDLKQTLQFQPSFVQNKIFIIDEVHMLTKEAFNALLKTLEEPPDYVYFVLATTEVEKIPDTIISRCQRFDFRRITEEAIKKHLIDIANQEQMKFEESALALIADASAGGLRDAISLLEQLNSLFEDLTENSVSLFLGRTEQKLCQQYIDQVIAGDLNGAIASVEEIMSAGHHLEQIYKDVLSLMRKRFLQAIANGQDPQIFLDLVEKLEQNYETFHKSAIPQLVFEVTAAQVANVSNFAPAEPREHRPTVAPKKTPPPKPVVVAEPAAAGSLRDFKRGWSKVVDKINDSKLRITLKQGHINSFMGDRVHIGFASNFHLEQINHAQQIADIEHMLQEVFGQKIYVELSTQITNTPTQPKPKVENMAPTAMDIFEGM